MIVTRDSDTVSRPAELEPGDRPGLTGDASESYVRRRVADRGRVTVTVKPERRPRPENHRGTE